MFHGADGAMLNKSFFRDTRGVVRYTKSRTALLLHLTKKKERTITHSTYPNAKLKILIRLKQKDREL